MIPLVDLAWQTAEIADEVREGFDAVIASNAFILGPQVAAFERDFAAFMGAAHCIGVGSGTDALELGLRTLGIGDGDEVIVPANTFIASALAVVRAGAKPVLVDIDDDYALIDPAAARTVVTSRTRAIMPVHLYGQMAPMAELEALASECGLQIIEDAAQSQGAKQNGRSAGSIGAIGETSFYPGKNIGAYGDAGAVLTHDGALAEAAGRLRNWGSDVKYHHPELGFNTRLDTLQAVVLSAKLARLAHWNELRREAADRYDALLDGCAGARLPATAPGNEHVWHLYTVRVDARDRVLRALNEAGIGAGIHYPVPIHLQGAFADMGLREGAFPQAESSANEVLSLPLFPGITEEQQTRVAEALRHALAS